MSKKIDGYNWITGLINFKKKRKKEMHTTRQHILCRRRHKNVIEALGKKKRIKTKD